MKYLNINRKAGTFEFTDDLIKNPGWVTFVKSGKADAQRALDAGQCIYAGQTSNLSDTFRLVQYKNIEEWEKAKTAISNLDTVFVFYVPAMATTPPKPIRRRSSGKEYITYLDGDRIDSRGFKSSYGVTASTKAEAKRIGAKARKYYGGTRVVVCGG